MRTAKDRTLAGGTLRRRPRPGQAGATPAQVLVVLLVLGVVGVVAFVALARVGV